MTNHNDDPTFERDAQGRLICSCCGEPVSDFDAVIAALETMQDILSNFDPAQKTQILATLAGTHLGSFIHEVGRKRMTTAFVRMVKNIIEDKAKNVAGEMETERLAALAGTPLHLAPDISSTIN